MVLRWNLLDKVVLHAMIGVGVGTVYAVRCYNKEHERKLFRFGGDDFFSVGTKAAWSRWFVVCYGFEFVSTFLVGGRHLYLELALSLVEAAAMAAGLFLVDRIALALSPEPDAQQETARAERARRAREHAGMD